MPSFSITPKRDLPGALGLDAVGAQHTPHAVEVENRLVDSLGAQYSKAVGVARLVGQDGVHLILKGLGQRSLEVDATVGSQVHGTGEGRGGVGAVQKAVPVTIGGRSERRTAVGIVSAHEDGHIFVLREGCDDAQRRPHRPAEAGAICSSGYSRRGR